MNKTGLIFIPLVFMFVLSMFALSGLETGQELGSGYTYGKYTENNAFYDWTGRAIVNASNFQPLAEAGQVRSYYHDFIIDVGAGQIYAIWQNSTWQMITKEGYYLYPTSNGNSTGDLPILYQDYTDYMSGANTNTLLNLTASFNSSYGLIALFISLMVGIGLAGIHFFGIGESETSLQTIFMGTGLIAVWCVFSAVSLSLLASVPLGLGAIFYFGLTLSYIIGMLMNIGKSS
jgi:hypothetical protein